MAAGTDVLAAKVVGHVGEVSRIPSRDHFASYAGAAPLEVSSGEQRRHRLSRAGNRQLNTALHMVALCQAHRPGPGQDYYRRKIAEGKSRKEANRALKRHLANVVYHRLITDHERALTRTT
jgi:transposase